MQGVVARPRLPVCAWVGFGRARQEVSRPKLFIFGLGYSGLGAAIYFLKRGWQVAGTCRTDERRERLRQCGLIDIFDFDPIDYENLNGKALDCLRTSTHVLSTVPPDDEHDVDPVIMAHAQTLSEAAESYRWVGYISSTSVYGDYGGEWVDEGSELRATGGKGWSRVMAEHEWLALHDNFGLPVHIFRCGGIYGPRRSALDSVQRSGGHAASASGARRAQQRYTARCHVYDICQTLEASARHPCPGAAYNIADDDPADRETVMAYAAELLARKEAGLPLTAAAMAAATAAPGFAGAGWAGAELDIPFSSYHSAGSGSDSYDSSDDFQALQPPLLLADERPWQRQQLSGRSRERGGAAAAAMRQLEEKRVSNQRIKTELGVQLRFPSFREGLASIATGDMRPFE